MVGVSQLINENGNPVVNQFVLIMNADNTTYTFFQSYNSVVAKWNNQTGDLSIGRDAFYSRTTKKYLMQFIRQFTLFNFNHIDDLRRAISDGRVKKVDYNFSSCYVK